MYSLGIEEHISNSLTGDAAQNALDFVAYLIGEDMQFELSATDYWRDKQYWYVKYQHEFVGFILINGHAPVRDETEPEGWIFWSDNYNSSIFADYPLDKDARIIAYKHVDISACGGGIAVNLFGQVFSPVCNGTTFRFNNPNSIEIEVIKQLIEIKKLDISGSGKEGAHERAKADTQNDKGRIIFLNGVTSAGKTSIVEALQARDDIFFYAVANDLFQEMIEGYLRIDYWKYLSEAIIMMYHTAKLFSDMGKHVLIDGILVERDELKPHYGQLLEILKDNPLDVVEVYCPLDICKQRNIARGDRYETQSAEQFELMAKNIKYSLSVDTSAHSPEECANIIMNKLFSNKP